MGYELHITRKESWKDKSGPQFTVEEWRALINGDPEMRLRKNDEATYIRYSKHVPGRREARFYLDGSGNIAAVNPDPEIRRKMFRMAKKTEAKVQGDGGEIYNHEGKSTGAFVWQVIWRKLLGPCW